MKFRKFPFYLFLSLLIVLATVRMYAQQLYVFPFENNDFQLEHFSIQNGHWNAAGAALNWYHGDSLFTETAMTSENLNGVRAHYLQFADESTRDRFLKDGDRLWDNIYRSDGHFYEKYGKQFYFQIDPLLEFGTWISGAETDGYTVNGRGILLNAGIGDRLKIFSSLQEIQRSFAQYTNDYIGNYRAVPGTILAKGYSSDLYGIQGGRDYNVARAMVQYEVNDWLQLSMGHDNNFIGNGYRSLLLNDFSAPYFHLKINTHLGRFHYQNIFAEISAEGTGDRRGDLLLTKKYFVNHYLGVSLTEDLSVGLSETVVFSRANQFELQYLNPVIFYRSVEHTLGSPDNAILGMNAQWDLFDRMRIYGQFTFDEFKFNEMFVDNNGWWGNKWGSQLGVQITDVALKNSILRVEWNRLRPYTFQHRDSVSNFTHARQPLAHPSGANLNEWLLEWNWLPNSNWRLRFLGLYQTSGFQRPNEVNFGSNPNQDFSDRTNDYEIYLINGPDQDILFGLLELRRRLWNQLNLSLEYRFRQQNLPEDMDLSREEHYLGLSLRWNWPTRDFAF